MIANRRRRRRQASLLPTLVERVPKPHSFCRYTLVIQRDQTKQIQESMITTLSQRTLMSLSLFHFAIIIIIISMIVIVTRNKECRKIKNTTEAII